MVLAWPHERVDPLRGFAAYGGGFNVLNTHYVASLAWTGFWGVVLAASVVVLSLLYAIARFGMWLCIRHQVKVLSARRTAADVKRARAARLTICAVFLFGVVGGATVLWVGGLHLRTAVVSALNATMSRVDALLESVQSVHDALAGVRAQVPDVGSVVDLASSTIDTVASLRRVAVTAISRVASYARWASIATTVIAAGFIAVGMLCLVATALSSPHGSLAVAIILWAVLIVAWFLSGVAFIFQVATGDACLSLNELLSPASVVQLQRLSRCTDDGGNATSSTWHTVRKVCDTVNVALYGFSSSGTGAGAAHLQQLGYKCNPAVALPDGTFGGASASCPTLMASLDALNNASLLLPHTVSADSSFAAAYVDYRCAITDRTACAAVGEIPSDTFDSLASQDASASQVVAIIPALERLTRCVDIREALADLHATHCPRMLVTTQLVFVGLVVVSSAFVLLVFLMLYGGRNFHTDESVLKRQVSAVTLGVESCHESNGNGTPDVPQQADAATEVAVEVPDDEEEQELAPVDPTQSRGAALTHLAAQQAHAEARS